jgi:transposase
MAQRLMLPVSNDPLRRVVRRRAREPADRLVAIGIDDFAWRRNHRYRTIVCDLERRRPVVLLKDREQATAEDWLKGRTSITIVARDRGRRVRRGRRTRLALCGPGHGSLASDGDRQPRLP